MLFSKPEVPPYDLHGVIKILTGRFLRREPRSVSKLTQDLTMPDKVDFPCGNSMPIIESYVKIYEYPQCKRRFPWH